MKQYLPLIVVLITLLIPIRHQAQGFTDSEILEIQFQSVFLTEECQNNLNTISNSLFSNYDIETIISNMMEGQNRIFYTPEIIIEDNVDPRNHSDNEFKSDFKAERYLNSLHLFYKKTEDPTIEFSNITFSELNRKNYPYILVKYTSKWAGSHSEINYTYRESERVIEYRVEKSNATNKISLYITAIRFFDESIEFVEPEDIIIEEGASISDAMAALTAEKERIAKVAGQQELLDELRIKEEKEAKIKKQEFDNFMAKGQKLMADAGLAKLSGEAFLDMYSAAQVEFENARDLLPQETGPRKVLQTIRDVKDKEREKELAKKLEEELKQGADFLINTARDYSLLRYNEKVIQTYNKFLKDFKGAKWDNSIDIDRLKQLNSFMIPLNTRINRKDYAGAIKELSKEIKARGDEWPELYYERAYLYNLEKNHKKAILDIDKAIEIDRNYFDAFILRGDIHKNFEDYYEASLDFESAKQIDPTSLKPYIKLANVKLLTDKQREAIEILRAAELIDPTDPEIPYQIGRVYLRDKNIEKARPEFRKAINLGKEFNREHASAYYERGKLRLLDGNFNEASNDFKMARSIGLSSSQVAYLKKKSIKYLKRGKSEVIAGNNESAIDYYTKGISIYDDLEALWFQRGKINYIEGKNDLGKIDFERAIERFEEWDSAYYYLGMCNVNLGDYKGAITAFENALRYSPGKYMPVSNMGSGIAKYHLKEYGQAQSSFITFLKAEENELAYYYYGRCLFIDGNYSRAAIEFQKAVNFNKKFGVGYYWRAKANEAKGGGKPSKVIEDLVLATQYGFQSDTVYNKLARYQYQANDFKEAIRTYGKSLEYNRKQPDVYIKRSKLYSRLKYYPNAAYDLIEAIKIDPIYGSSSNYANLAKFSYLDGKLEEAIQYADESNKQDPNSDAYYYKACALMSSDERANALISLEEAIKLGDITIESIKKSECFKAISNSDQFKESINKYYNK